MGFTYLNTSETAFQLDFSRHYSPDDVTYHLRASGADFSYDANGLLTDGTVTGFTLHVSVTYFDGQPNETHGYYLLQQFHLVAWDVAEILAEPFDWPNASQDGSLTTTPFFSRVLSTSLPSAWAYDADGARQTIFFPELHENLPFVQGYGATPHLLKGTQQRDEFMFVGNAARVDTGAGNDSIYVKETAGSVTAWLRRGDDTFSGNNGDNSDWVDGGNGNDRLSLRGGDDRAIGGAGHDILTLGDGDDRARGGAGRDILQGGDGNDVLIGGEGQDILSGDNWFSDSGSDWMHGGAGADLFHLPRHSDHWLYTAGKTERDVVRDFTAGEDRIFLDLDDTFDHRPTQAEQHTYFHENAREVGADTVLLFSEMVIRLPRISSVDASFSNLTTQGPTRIKHEVIFRDTALEDFRQDVFFLPTLSVNPYTWYPSHSDFLDF